MQVCSAKLRKHQQRRERPHERHRPLLQVIPKRCAAARLAESVRRHNTTRIPFYISCPASDLALFKEKVGNDGVTFLTDEEILATNPAIDKKAFDALPGSITQQIVKSEFWRLGLSENYLGNPPIFRGAQK